MNKKNIPVLLLTLLLVIGLQCKKEEEFPEEVTWGFIIDEVTLEPIEGAKVLFYNSEISTSQSHSTWLMDSTYTDQKGFFKKKWKLLKGKATQMNYFKQGYYHYKGLKMNAFGDVGSLTLKPNKNFRLHIKNVHPVRVNDSLFVNIGYSTDGDYRSMPPRWFVGEYDTIVNVRIAYDEPYWWISYHFKDEDGSIHYYSSNPPCVPLDTCEIRIEF